MLAVVVDGNDNFIAVHRTWLRADGSGKADLVEPKMSLGPIGGGAVRLAPPAPMLVVAEGIETALSATAATGMAAWSAINATNLARLPLPRAVEEVVILADNDRSGTGERAARCAAERWIAEGRRVRLALPPEQGQDANDLLRGEGEQHVDRWYRQGEGADRRCGGIAPAAHA
jgi:putative DNA primase/helicase